MSIFCCQSDVKAAQVNGEYTGLALPTTEEEGFLDSIPMVEQVNLNEDALDYIKKNYENLDLKKFNQIEKAEVGEEFISENDIRLRTQKTVSNDAQEEIISQVTSYDGSLNKTFPPIKSQGTTGSCTLWSMGYYQLTNNIAKVRGLDVKGTGTKYCIAPGWLYSICKSEGGRDDCFESTVLSVLMKQGAPYWSEKYGPTTKVNEKVWNSDAEVWEKALENRIQEYEYISLETDNEFDLTKLKSALLNGYVVSFASYYTKNNSEKDWIMGLEEDGNRTVLKAMGKNLSDKSRKLVGHEMTVVGFDDNIKIDYGIDPVTKQHEYGYGALKIANSWNTSLEESGYFWIAYDALKEKSEFSGDHTSYRVPAINRKRVLLIMPRKSYTPLLIAKLTVETNSRRQLALAMDIAPDVSEAGMRYIYRYENNVDKGKEYKVPFWFKNWDITNQELGFSGEALGTGQRESANFVFDLTDTVLQKYNKTNNSNGNNNMSFYVYIQDKFRDSYSSALTKIEIIDRINNKTVSKETDLTANGDVKFEKLDFTVSPRIVGEQKVFELNFNYPIQSSTISQGLKIRKREKSASGYTSSLCKTLCPISTDRKKVTVSIAGGKYEEGSYYSMDLSALRSDGNNSIAGQNIFDFYIPGY